MIIIIIVKSFQLIYVSKACFRSFFFSPQRREVVIGGNGIVFTYTEPLLFEGVKYTMRNIYLMHVMAVQIHIKVFELPLFSWDSLEDIIRNSKITGARAETVDIFPVVHLYIFIVAEETVQLSNDFQR